MNEKKPLKKTIKYPFASAWARFFCALIDYLIVIVVFVGLYFAIFWTDKNFISLTKTNTDWWRYFLFSFIAFTFMCSYFIGLPYFWKGKTLSRYCFKIKVVNVLLIDNFLYNLFLRELLTWLIPLTVSLMFSILCAVFSEHATDIICALLNQYDSITWDGARIIAPIFESLYLICGIFQVIIIFYLFWKNRRRCIQDLISNTATIKLIPITKDKNLSSNTITKSKRNYALPGDIPESAFEEIDSW